MNYLKIKYRLLVYLTSFTVCSEDIKKSSENDQSTGHFKSFLFFVPDPKSEKNPVNQQIKKLWPYFLATRVFCMFFVIS